MRLYTFGNFYLSGIQQGIQAAHVLGDMMVKYPHKSIQNKTLHKWANFHKTMMCLDGGNAQNIEEIHNFFKNLEQEHNMDLPYEIFHEDKQSLNLSATCTGIVVPQHIYQASYILKNCTKKEIKECKKEMKTWELKLAEEINKYGFAK